MGNGKMTQGKLTVGQIGCGAFANAQHLPNVTVRRDFYRADAENCKFFRRAVEAGLHIAEVPFGMDRIQVIELKPFYDIGMHLMKADPRVLLCDDPGCMFCREY